MLTLTPYVVCGILGPTKSKFLSIIYIYRIVTSTTIQGVVPVASASVKDVVAIATAQNIVADAALQSVVALTAVNNIMATATSKNVAPFATMDGTISANGIGAGCTKTFVLDVAGNLAIGRDSQGDIVNQQRIFHTIVAEDLRVKALEYPNALLTQHGR